MSQQGSCVGHCNEALPVKASEWCRSEQGSLVITARVPCEHNKRTSYGQSTEPCKLQKGASLVTESPCMPQQGSIVSHRKRISRVKARECCRL